MVKKIVVYQEFKVVVDLLNLVWTGDKDECTLPINCTIDTQSDDAPEDDDLGSSPDRTLMDQLDKIKGLYFEVS
jgi:hypothetical protein